MRLAAFCVINLVADFAFLIDTKMAHLLTTCTLLPLVVNRCIK
jgi:hypothetical protein